jgi:TonB family protein
MAPEMMNAGYKTKEGRRTFYFAIVLALGLISAAVSCKKPEESKIYSLNDGVKPPVVLAKPLPGYTEAARMNRIEGTLKLQAVIRKDGSIDSFKVLKSLGYGLDESTIDTIKTKWRFQPGTLEGKPVNIRSEIEINFKFVDQIM